VKGELGVKQGEVTELREEVTRVKGAIAVLIGSK
jgi:hypothetical protein